MKEKDSENEIGVVIGIFGAKERAEKIKQVTSIRSWIIFIYQIHVNMFESWNS